MTFEGGGYGRLWR